MTENKHTPGPWEMFSTGARIGVFSVTADADVAHCGGFHSRRSRDEEEANARLIAAAPDLLATCKALLANAEFADGQGVILTHDAEALEAAIAKAEGNNG